MALANRSRAPSRVVSCKFNLRNKIARPRCLEVGKRNGGVLTGFNRRRRKHYDCVTHPSLPPHPRRASCYPDEEVREYFLRFVPVESKNFSLFFFPSNEILPPSVSIFCFFQFQFKDSLEKPLINVISSLQVSSQKREK